jgi:hypothetical protein
MHSCFTREDDHLLLRALASVLERCAQVSDQ